MVMTAEQARYRDRKATIPENRRHFVSCEDAEPTLCRAAVTSWRSKPRMACGLAFRRGLRLKAATGTCATTQLALFERHGIANPVSITSSWPSANG
jgi:hypothetical protein